MKHPQKTQKQLHNTHSEQKQIQPMIHNILLQKHEAHTKPSKDGNKTHKQANK